MGKQRIQTQITVQKAMFLMPRPAGCLSAESFARVSTFPGTYFRERSAEVEWASFFALAR